MLLSMGVNLSFLAGDLFNLYVGFEVFLVASYVLLTLGASPQRVRAGIGRPPGRQDVADFVLSNYSTVERNELPFQVGDAADAVESLITDGLEKTQQRFNS